MLVLLRANFTTPWASARRGFKALYKAGELNLSGTLSSETLKLCKILHLQLKSPLK